MARSTKPWWVAAAVVLVLLALAGINRWYTFPTEPFRALQNADQYELLSLLPPLLVHPETLPAEGSSFYHCIVLGRTTIADPSTRDALNEALATGVKQSDGTADACFNPRHGIRVTHAGITTDFIICFECQQVEVWRNGAMIAHFLTSHSPQPVFDEVLTKAKVPLAPKEP